MNYNLCLVLAALGLSSSFTSSSSRDSVLYIKAENLRKEYSSFKSDQNFLKKKAEEIGKEAQLKFASFEIRGEELRKKDKLSAAEEKELKDMEKELVDFYQLKQAEMMNATKAMHEKSNAEIRKALNKFVKKGVTVLEGEGVIYGGKDITNEILKELEKEEKNQKLNQISGKKLDIFTFDMQAFSEKYKPFREIEEFKASKIKTIEIEVAKLEALEGEELEKQHNKISNMEYELKGAIIVMAEKIDKDLKDAFLKVANERKVDLIVDPSAILAGDAISIDEEILKTIKELQKSGGDETDEKTLAPIPSEVGYVFEPKLRMQSKKYVSYKEEKNRLNEEFYKELEQFNQKLEKAKDEGKSDDEMKKISQEALEFMTQHKGTVDSLKKSFNGEFSAEIRAASKALAKKENVSIIFKMPSSSGVYYSGTDLTQKMIDSFKS